MNLSEIIKTSGLSDVKQNALFLSFDDYARKANEWKEKADAIIVKSEDDKVAMKEADTARKIIKNIRVDIEKKRKELKDSSLKEGQLIDKIARSLKELIEPIEADLTYKASYAELMQKEREDKLRIERNVMINPYSEFVPFGLNLGTMPEDDFIKLFDGAKLQYEHKIAENKRLEEERIAKEREEALERERIKAENLRLKIESEAKEKELAVERDKIRKLEQDKRQKELEEKERLLKIQKEEENKKNLSDVDKLYQLVEVLKNIEYPDVNYNFSFIISDVKSQINDVIQSLINLIEN